MADSSDILDLLMNGDPAAAQARQAAMLRGTQAFGTMASGANDQAHSLDMLNFVAQNANNPTLAKSVGALQASQQAQYTPVKLDKGMYVPATGDYQESPGVADEREQDRQTKRLQAASVMQARQDAANASADARTYAADQAREGRVLAATIAAQGQRDRAADRADKNTQAEADRQRRMFDTSEGRVATQARSTNLPALIGSSTEIANRLQGYVDAGQGGSIPGLNPVDKMKLKALDATGLPYSTPMIGVSPEAAQNAAMVKSAILDQLKTQVGLGATERARNEQLIETLSGTGASSMDYINAYNNAIHPRLENQRKAILGITSSWSPDDWDRHLAAGGIDYRVAIPKINVGGRKSSGTVSNGPAVSATPTLDPAVAKKYGL